MNFNLQFSNLSKLFEQSYLLNEINLHIGSDEFLAIIGPSGAGKTMLARMMKGFISSTSGTIYLNESKVEATDLLKNKQIQLVFQNAYDSFTPHRKIFDVILEIFGDKYTINGLFVSEFIKVLSKELSLNPSYLNKFPHELSGGERQRVALLVALLAKPKLLICDEVLSSLELPLQKQVLDIIVKYQKKFGFSFIMITHDILLLAQYFKRVVLIDKGRIAYDGKTNVLSANKTSEFLNQCYSAIDWLNSR